MTIAPSSYDHIASLGARLANLRTVDGYALGCSPSATTRSTTIMGS